ncbi:MAG: Asp-tRNA(Asn)/Glu-tRNA(Gln) amidotransferase subunit GatC [Lachnospiraceae bacterium]|nr:Asp-tRNA(Asn)/Glu-tRNA(Gln) amidotransferase subunit GatC [Lachnospiraceae bacterium]
MQNIDKLAVTKKLKLTDGEKEFLADKKKLLEDSFTILAQVNTDDTEPLVSVLETRNILRDDIAAKMISREELLINAPEQYDGYFRVPKTID